MIFPLCFFVSAVLAVPHPAPINPAPVTISAAAKTSSKTAEETVIVVTKGKSTYTETFIATSLSKYSTLTKPTTITTTDSKGAAAVVEIFAGGLAWAAIPKAGPVPPVDPPPGPPTEPPSTAQPTSKPTSKPSPSTTKSSATKLTTSSKKPLKTVTAAVNLAPPDWRSWWDQAIIALPDDTKACGWGPKAPSVDGNAALGKVDVFCKDQNHKALTTNGVNENFNMGAGIVLNLTVSLAPICPKDTDEALDQGDCSLRLKEAISSCDKGSSKHGGTIKDGCLTYVAQPQEHDGNLVCNGHKGDSTGLNRDEALKNIKDFCQKNHGGKVSPSQGNSNQYHMALGNSQQELSVSYNASCPRGGSATYTIDETACNRFLQQTIDACDKDSKPPYGKFGGNVTDHCGVYSINAHVVEVFSCGKNPYKPSHAMTQKDVTNAVNDYCEEDLTLDPNYQSDNTFQQTTPSGVSSDNYVKGLNNYVIRMRAYFAGDDYRGCSKKKTFSTKGDECKRKLNAVIGKCGLKDGGSLVDRGPNGCVVWTIFGQDTSN